MEKNISTALELINDYNQLYHTTFKASERWRLFPDQDGVCEFQCLEWPGNHRAGVYLILSEDDEVIYVGQTTSFGYRLSQHFKNVAGNCSIRSEAWSKQPVSIVVIPTLDDREYERLSLEEFLIQRLQPCDNTRGK